MKNCCNHGKGDKVCRNKRRTFKLPRKFTKKQCIPYKRVKGFSKKSSCAPYKECKKRTTKKKSSKRRTTKNRKQHKLNLIFKKKDNILFSDVISSYFHP